MNDWGPYQTLVDQMVATCKFRSLTKLKDLSGRSGAQTFLVQPRWDKGRLDPAILKLGTDAVIQKDVEGLDQARFLYPGANYLLQEARGDGCRALLLRFAGSADCQTFEDF